LKNNSVKRGSGKGLLGGGLIVDQKGKIGGKKGGRVHPERGEGMRKKSFERGIAGFRGEAKHHSKMGRLSMKQRQGGGTTFRRNKDAQGGRLCDKERQMSAFLKKEAFT